MAVQRTLEKLEEIARDSRPDLPSILNCNPINPTIGKELENYGFRVRDIKGTFSTGRSHVGGESHMFLRVNSGDVKGCSLPIIVDGAIDQFCIKNYDEGRVFEQVGPKEEIPRVAVLTQDMDLYGCYYEAENF